MADMHTLDTCFESSPPPATGDECIDPQLLGSSANFLLPTSSERDSEGRTEDSGTEDSGPMALDTLPTASDSSSSTAVRDYKVEQGASASLRGLSLSLPLGSLYDGWEKEGRGKGKGNEKEKRSRYLRRCARVTGVRDRTALF
jgi:hypothetical protein